MKLPIALLFSTVLLLACSGQGDNFDFCASSSDYREFSCIMHNDFLDHTGTSTSLSQTIAACTVLASTDQPCSIATLPFLASMGSDANPSPSRAQILERLIVSQPWMAENFSLLLEQMPPDMLDLFASVTAIVIHDKIRPAFFWYKTAAIYIDPYYLWMTPAQRLSISTAADYRSDFDKDLAFTSLARYSKNGNYAFDSGDTRSPEQALYALSAILFHELAHARDSFPAASVANPDSNLSPADLGPQLLELSVSRTLHNSSPLQDETLLELAKVMYLGKTASAELKAITASAAGALLEGDGANDDYAYTSQQEDSAMLFEETMMKIHFDIDREIAYASVLHEEQASCADFSFDWKAINRFAVANVLPRTRLVIDAMLPGHSHAAFLDTAVADGTFSWCESAAATITTRPASFRRDYWH